VKVIVVDDPGVTDPGLALRIPEPSGETLTSTFGEEASAVKLPEAVDASEARNVEDPGLVGAMALETPAPAPYVIVSVDPERRVTPETVIT
jgi:hypothetical protein